MPPARMAFGGRLTVPLPSLKSWLAAYLALLPDSPRTQPRTSTQLFQERACSTLPIPRAPQAERTSQPPGLGLPSSDKFDFALIDINQANPRPYVWFLKNGATVSLFT